MNETDNPYRAPQTMGRRIPAADAGRRWWFYLASHFVAVVLTGAFCVLYIKGDHNTLQSPLLGLVVAAFLPIGGLVDLYLWASVLKRPHARLRLAVVDSLLTAVQLYLTLLPAVSP